MKEKNSGRTFWDFASENPEVILGGVFIVAAIVGLTLEQFFCIFK